MRTTSVVAFALMVAGLGVLVAYDSIIATRPIAIAVQITAVLLMIYARITFGRRSFHAAANPTEGGVVTWGPYAVLRHPIYAAVLYFTWAAAIDHLSWISVAGAALITLGAIVRMLLEERMLVRRYPEYRDYMRRTRRVVPYVI
jgi:protein-S-isoprenylcysteine O-methyltransferase Ste14